jgi:hypothetical protein
MVVIRAARIDVQRQLGLHREPLERVRQEGDREATHAAAVETEHDLRVRAADEVDRGGRERLVHRHGRGAVACDPLAAVERLGKRVAERREHILDRVVLVHVDVAAGQDLEVEPAVESELREQVVEEADAGRDARPALTVERERDPQRCLGRRPDDERRPGRGRRGRRRGSRGCGRSRPGVGP